MLWTDLMVSTRSTLEHAQYLVTCLVSLTCDRLYCEQKCFICLSNQLL